MKKLNVLSKLLVLSLLAGFAAETQSGWLDGLKRKRFAIAALAGAGVCVGAAFVYKYFFSSDAKKEREYKRNRKEADSLWGKEENFIISRACDHFKVYQLWLFFSFEGKNPDFNRWLNNDRQLDEDHLKRKNCFMKQIAELNENNRKVILARMYISPYLGTSWKMLRSWKNSEFIEDFVKDLYGTRDDYEEYLRGEGILRYHWKKK